MIRVGVVGYGYWGPNLLRTFTEIPGSEVVAVADRDPDRLAQAQDRFPQVEVFANSHDRLVDLDLDAVVVCTPPETHYEVARRFVESDLDVFVEKPLTTDASSAAELVELADARGRVLMVGHIGAYAPAVRAMKELIDRGDLGDIAYLDAARGGLGLFHPSLNVIWDLAPHDISILMYLLDACPISVSARGSACVKETIEDVAYITLGFPNGVLAHLRLSWLDPCKTRRVTVVGRQQMAVYDDLENHEKLKVYDKHVDAIRHTDTFGEHQFAYHYGSVVSPYLHQDEPLKLECLHFLESVRDRRSPLTDGLNGLSVVRVIEAAQWSLQCGGVQVPIPVGTNRLGVPDGQAAIIDLTEIEQRAAAADQAPALTASAATEGERAGPNGAEHSQAFGSLLPRRSGTRAGSEHEKEPQVAEA